MNSQSGTLTNKNRTMNNTLKIATYNVRGLKDGDKRRKIFNYFRIKKYDIICLQETHFEQKDTKKLNTEWNGKKYHSFGTNQSRGVSILFGEYFSTDSEPITLENGRSGRVYIIKFQYNEKSYCVANIYAPNHGEERKKFFKECDNKIKGSTEKDDILLVGGDFNCVLNISLERTNRTRHIDIGQNEFKTLIKNNLLEDNWRRRNPEKTEFTWDGGETRANKSRIDFWLI